MERIKSYKSVILSVVLLILLIGIQILFLECSQNHIHFKFDKKILPFNEGWRFTNDSVSFPVTPGFDDSHWRVVNLPHDWSIEDLPFQEPGVTVGPFTKNSNGPRDGMSNGHTVGGTGWYRNKWLFSKDDSVKHICLYFEGAYTETDVWVNGSIVGSHKHGYTSFYFDITPFCLFNGDSTTITVRVKNLGQNSRWYSGSGLYRKVKLIVTNEVFIEPWDVFVTTPKVTDEQAQVLISTDFINKGRKVQAGIVKILIFDNEDKNVAVSKQPFTFESGLKTRTLISLSIEQPKLWSVEHPVLYTAEISLWMDGKIVDAEKVSFGIRTIEFCPENGFLLNGKPLELKGGCVHHDNGILGAAAYDRAEERRVEILKSNGFNAIRSSHYPPSEKFLDACDRLGMLVIDESFDMWQLPKNKDDYHQFFDSCWESDFSSVILRDRNHPSVILWSLGNEIEERADSSGIEITKKLIQVAKNLDPTRLVTEAVNEFWDHPGRKWEMTAPAFELLDVCGYNYQWWQYEPDHQQFPKRVMLGTESVPKHAFENWQLVEKHPYVVGDFVWTAMDYLGESGVGHAGCENDNNEQLKPWPWFNAWCGDIDLIGNKKPQSYYRDVLWGNSLVEMAVHAPMEKGCTENVSYWGWPDELQSWTWNGHEGESLNVAVYSKAEKVQLWLNGKLIGEKVVSDSTRYAASFKVPYQPGELKALAFNKNQQVGEKLFQTASKPYRLKLTTDRQKLAADGNDLSFISVEVLDNNGILVPDAQIPVWFTIEGPGKILAVGNANPSEMVSFHQEHCQTFRGKCLVVIQSAKEKGNIQLMAESEGLPASKEIIQVEK